MCSCICCDAATVSPNEIKIFLANSFITFFINGDPLFSNGPRILPRNLPDCIILDNWVSDNLISADELFASALLRFG